MEEERSAITLSVLIYIIVAAERDKIWKIVLTNSVISISECNVNTEQHIAFMLSNVHMLVACQFQNFCVKKLSITLILKLSVVMVFADLH